MPAYFVVRRTNGPAWDSSRPMREQHLWAKHTAFMDALTAEGFVVLFGGPLGIPGGAGSEILLVADVAPWTVLLRGRAA